jgi:hypothetical protein
MCRDLDRLLPSLAAEGREKDYTPPAEADSKKQARALFG